MPPSVCALLRSSRIFVLHISSWSLSDASADASWWLQSRQRRATPFRVNTKIKDRKSAIHFLFISILLKQAPSAHVLFVSVTRTQHFAEVGSEVQNFYITFLKKHLSSDQIAKVKTIYISAEQFETRSLEDERLDMVWMLRCRSWRARVWSGEWLNSPAIEIDIRCNPKRVW